MTDWSMVVAPWLWHETVPSADTKQPAITIICGFFIFIWTWQVIEKKQNYLLKHSKSQTFLNFTSLLFSEKALLSVWWWLWSTFLEGNQFSYNFCLCWCSFFLTLFIYVYCCWKAAEPPVLCNRITKKVFISNYNNAKQKQNYAAIFTLFRP